MEYTGSIGYSTKIPDVPVYTHTYPAIKEGNDVRDANLLRSIKLPTGGTQDLIFQPNYLSGGSRIKQILYKDSDGTIINSRSYEYDNKSSYGTPTYYFTFSVEDAGGDITIGFISFTVNECSDDFIEIHSESLTDMFDLAGSPVYYGKVTEIFNDGSKIVRNFTNFNDHGDIDPDLNGTDPSIDITVNSPPFVPKTTRFWERGLLTEELVYDNENNLLSQTNNYYDFLINDVKSVKATMSQFHRKTFDFRTYLSGSYYLTSKPLLLKYTTTKIYDQLNKSDFAEEVTEYEYDSDHLQLNSLIEYNANENIKYITEYRYAQDLANVAGPEQIGTAADGYGKMISSNIVATPIETTDWIKKGNDGKELIGSELLTFRREDVNGSLYPLVPDKVYTLKISNPTTSFSPINFNTNKTLIQFDDRYEINKLFDKYDQFGNLTKETLRDGTIKAYEWGYNNNLLTNITVNPDLPNPIKTNYDYSPLIGVTKITDTNGKTITYEYDQFHRLKLIRDNDGNILKTFSYKYAFEQE